MKPLACVQLSLIHLSGGNVSYVSHPHISNAHSAPDNAISTIESSTNKSKTQFEAVDDRGVPDPNPPSPPQRQWLDTSTEATRPCCSVYGRYIGSQQHPAVSIGRISKQRD